MSKLSGANSNWQDCMNAGKQSFQRGDLNTAARAYFKATELRPKEAAGWINLGSTLLAGGKLDAAMRALDTAIRLNPAVAASHILLGDTLRQRGNLSASLAAYQRAVKLERSPLALNKLACALRSNSQVEEAEALYREAIAADPDFNLPKINLATMQLECGNLSQAEVLLEAIHPTTLHAQEKREVDSARLALAEHHRLAPAIELLVENADHSELTNRLRELPADLNHVDEGALKTAERYLASTQRIGNPTPVTLVELPQDWIRIEALFMVPMVNTVAEYRELCANLEKGPEMTPELRASLNMQPAIRAARECKGKFDEPVEAEVSLRHWHALTGEGIANYNGGHFKYTQNWTGALNTTLKRVEPIYASATFQQFIKVMYPQFAPGLLRAAATFMAVWDLHCFADGNGRVLITWLNRELEWNGLMPALFNAELGSKGALNRAIAEVHSRDGDLAPLLSVITSAQEFAREFCAELRATT